MGPVGVRCSSAELVLPVLLPHVVVQELLPLFTAQLDPDTLQLCDVEDAFHPFAFAAKVQSEDFPTHNEILCMHGEERCKWIEAVDAEMSDLTECKACELVPQSEGLAKGKQVIKSVWAFRRKRRLDGSVSRCKGRLCVRGNIQREQNAHSRNETKLLLLLLNGPQSTCSSLSAQLAIGRRLPLISSPP
jgi:hypothetical protein